jgi:hypothetical protein
MEEHGITVKGVDVPRPVFQFDEAGFPVHLAKHMYEQFQKPTVIQV